MVDGIGTLLVLGASGDLAGRLLLPGLGDLLAASPSRKLLLLGAGAERWDEQTWRGRVQASFAAAGASGPAVDATVAGTHYEAADVTRPDDLRRLLALCEGTPAVYFALPPAVTARACDALGQVPLPPGTVLVLEKPFGTDRARAMALNEVLAGLVPEHRIHRIDHFLGKSTVLNLLGLRFANRLFEPLWSAAHIESVEIAYEEDLGLEGRARYYDGAGALMDMIQSHLLQVLAIVAMDPPATVGPDDLRDRKAEVLRATRVWGGDGATAGRRARYGAGTAGGHATPGYAHEEGVDPGRGTETLAEVTLEVANWRWAGVPFRLRSGKALSARRKEIVVNFRPVPHVPTGLRGTAEPSRLRIGLGPDRLVLELDVNGPGDPFTLERCELTAEFGAGALPAYGEVLAGVLADDPTLAVRGDTAVECWRIVEPVLRAWSADLVPLDEYPAGSPGPASWADTAAADTADAATPAYPGLS